MRCAQERAAFSPDGRRQGAGLRAASSSRRHRTPSLAEGHRPGPRRIAARPPRHGGPQVRIAGRRTQCRTRPFAPPAPRLRDRMRWAGGRVTPQGACGGAEGTWWRFKVAAYRSRAHAVGRSRAQAPRAARHAGGPCVGLPHARHWAFLWQCRSAAHARQESIPASHAPLQALAMTAPVAAWQDRASRSVA